MCVCVLVLVYPVINNCSYTINNQFPISLNSTLPLTVNIASRRGLNSKVDHESIPKSNIVSAHFHSIVNISTYSNGYYGGGRTSSFCYTYVIIELLEIVTKAQKCNALKFTRVLLSMSML